MSNDPNAFSQAWARVANLSLVSRRDLFRGAAATVGGVAIVAGTVMPAEAKMTLKAAGYQDTPNKDGSNCASCALFKAPSSCTLVDGTISANGWCRFYSKKS